MRPTGIFTSLVCLFLTGCGSEGEGDTSQTSESGIGVSSTPPTTDASSSATNDSETKSGSSTSSDSDDSDDSDNPTDSSTSATTNATGVKFDVGGSGQTSESDSDTEGECGPTPDGILKGRVLAPNLELPISGALVYVTSGPVDPIPDGTYCAECVKLDCDTPFTTTAADGTFSLAADSGQGLKLVVQKGQFLRVVDIDISPGSNEIPETQSNLPGVWKPDSGMWIPRIAVYETYPDAVYNVLAKFGLAQVSGSGVMVPGTEQFTLISDSDQGAFMDDPIEMSQYHIIFVPCASTKQWIGAPGVPAQRTDNIQEYVAAGGKWYATDHSNEYIEAPFSAYQEFHNPGMPDIQPAYSSDGTVLDPELLAWLSALPAPLKDIGGGNPTLYQLPMVTTENNFSGIDQIAEILVDDMMGGQVNVGHHTWVEGPCQSCTNPQQARPMAVSGQYGCGRMMYSTFETSSTAHNGLSPQELVLLYMILEITTCFENTPPPPPN